MKKLLAAAVLITLLGTACKKCIECSYVVDNVTYSSGEVCGSPADISETERAWEKDASFFNTVATCVDK